MPAQPEGDEVVEVLTRVSTWPPAGQAVVESNVTSVVDKTMEKYGRIDVLSNNARMCWCAQRVDIGGPGRFKKGEVL